MRTVRLNILDIDQALRDLKDAKQWLKEKSTEFCNQLAEQGAVKANYEFSKAVYDGTNDVVVRSEPRSEGRAAVVAEGEATLFIEFGSGITYPDSHPEAAALGMVHGQYGYKLGSNPNGWRYPGEKGPGSNGEIIPEGEPHAGMIKTYGNPANMSMYFTVKELERRVPELARRVFS